MAMVELVRSGIGEREVARRFRVTLRTVQRWVNRSAGRKITNVDWSDRSRSPHRVHNRTRPVMEQAVLEYRKKLASPENPLGFVGPEAIRDALRSDGVAAPHPRTIARILKRHGAVDHKVRRRFSAPPTGWYLPSVAKRMADVDAFDVIEDLAIEGKGTVDVFTTVSLWAPYAQAWPAGAVTARYITDLLALHWRNIGLPSYAQFDNDTRFQGGHNHPDVVGRVMRMCLSLGVTPVFAPPRETGFQANIEHFNGLWEKKVWHRFHHENLDALRVRSSRFIAAYVQRRAARSDRIPERRPFPANWKLDLQRPPQGKIVYIRRTDEHGRTLVLGRSFDIDEKWMHRLIRCEVDLDQYKIDVYRLRRREPEDQPLLATIEYRLPKRRFVE